MSAHHPLKCHTSADTFLHVLFSCMISNLFNTIAPYHTLWLCCFMFAVQLHYFVIYFWCCCIDLLL